jgi:hypothetical protein
MPNAFCSQQDSVVQVYVGHAAITESLTRVEDVRDLDSRHFLGFLEAQKWIDVVD